MAIGVNRMYDYHGRMTTYWQDLTTKVGEGVRARSAVHRLTRAEEHIPFVLPLTVLGALLAAREQGVNLDFRLALVAAANVLAVAYAFMLNDIEDAANDAVDPERAARNVICTGGLSVSAARWLSGLAALASAALYLLAGPRVGAIGLVILALGHFYSWRRVRLKAYPIVDLVSHAMMLGGLLVVAGSSLYGGPDLLAGWHLAAAATAFSAYGQLYNQLRDFDVDQLAGLRNTANLLGPRVTSGLMYLCVALAIMLLGSAALQGHFPVGLLLALALGILVSWRLGNSTDMRGGRPFETSGVLQTRGLWTLNFIAGAWFLWVLVAPLFDGRIFPSLFGG